MDVNYLYYRQQIERMRADAAACEASRTAHLDLAGRYDALIAMRKQDAAAQTAAPALD